MECLACTISIEDNDLILCALCTGPYHFACLNMSADYFMAKRDELQKSWRCPSCQNNINTRRNLKTDETLTKSIFENSPPSFMSYEEETAGGSRNLSSEQIGLDQIGALLDTKLDQLQKVITCEIKKEFHSMVERLKNDFSETTDFLSAQIMDLKKDTDSVRDRLRELEHENTRLRADAAIMKSQLATTADLSGLHASIDKLQQDVNEKDQQTLLNDIEITGIPEFPGESANHIVMSVATKLGMNLEARDVISASRVGPRRAAGAEAAAPGPRARPLVVRLSRRALRNELIKGARVRRGATTTDLGLPANPPTKFYVNERLTKMNRILFDKTREAGRSASPPWKFVWTSEGRICAKRTDSANSLVHNIRNEKDIERIFGTDLGSKIN